MNEELRKEIASLKLHAWLNSIGIILFLSIMSLFRNLTAKIQKSPDISHARRGTRISK